MRGPAILPPLVLALAACNTGASPQLGDALGEGQAFPASGGKCGAARLQGLVGQDASAINGASFPGESRVIYPGTQAGPRFVSDRATVKVDNQNRIVSIQCG